jgi:hypothetical protein
MAKTTPSKPPPSRSLSPQAARQRRLQAARLFQQGLSEVEIARRLGSPGRPPAAGMPAGLRAAAGLADRGRWGRVPRLTDSDWRQVERALLASASAQGSDTDLWTLQQAVDDRRGWRNEPGDGSECVGLPAGRLPGADHSLLDRSQPG